MTHVVVATIVRGHASVDASGGTGGGAPGRASFCGLIRADGKQRHGPGASSNPSPKSLSDVFGIGNERPIAINSADVDVDLVTEV